MPAFRPVVVGTGGSDTSLAAADADRTVRGWWLLGSVPSSGRLHGPMPSAAARRPDVDALAAHTS